MAGPQGMLGKPAGWYQDPAPANPASPETVRYWDGQNWTGQVRLASKKERVAWREQAEEANRAYVRDLVQRANAGDQEAQRILTGPPQGPGTRNTTPDGQVVSGWWRRVFAEIVDGIIVGIVATILMWPWLRDLVETTNAFTQRVTSAAQAGIDPPPIGPFVSDILPSLVVMGVIGFLLGLAYEVGFLKAFNATPGKMLLGLEVRMRAYPGAMPWSAVLVRWLTKRGYTVLNVIPFVALVTGLYGLLDYLWPLLDSRRQALHDKMARTNVVRR